MRFTRGVPSGSGPEQQSRECSGSSGHPDGHSISRSMLGLWIWKGSLAFHPTLTSCFLQLGTHLCPLRLGSQLSGPLGEPPTHQASVLGPQALSCLGQLSSCLPGLGWTAPEWATHPGRDGEPLNGQPPFVETRMALKALILGAQDIRGGGCVSWL